MLWTDWKNSSLELARNTWHETPTPTPTPTPTTQHTNNTQTTTNNHDLLKMPSVLRTLLSFPRSGVDHQLADTSYSSVAPGSLRLFAANPFLSPSAFLIAGFDPPIPF
jgi:hypothetical protein